MHSTFPGMVAVDFSDQNVHGCFSYFFRIKCALLSEQSSDSLRCETPFFLAAKPLLIKAQ